MKKVALFVLVVIISAFVFVFKVGAGGGNVKLTRGQGYTLDQLSEFNSLKDINCGNPGYELCETLGHFGVLYVDQSGYERIRGLFKAPNGLWYVTHPWDVFKYADNACFPYETVAFHQSGACPLDSKNPLCVDYIARPGYVYNWNPDGKWPVGVIPLVAGYYAAGNPKGTLYCKVQQ